MIKAQVTVTSLDYMGKKYPLKSARHLSTLVVTANEHNSTFVVTHMCDQ